MTESTKPTTKPTVGISPEAAEKFNAAIARIAAALAEAPRRMAALERERKERQRKERP